MRHPAHLAHRRPCQTRYKGWREGFEGGDDGRPSKGHTTVPEAPSASNEAPANEPLSLEFVTRFRAKLEPYHAYLAVRGVPSLIADHFELAFCPADPKSMMRNRVVIPIHDEHGVCLAYAGRWVGDDVPEGEGKYKLPPKFGKQFVLYNLHRVRSRKHLVLVEGYFSVFRLVELGVPAVALMGSSHSGAQVAL